MGTLLQRFMSESAETQSAQVSVSEEEASNALTEALEQHAEIESDFDLIARSEDITDALEDLKEVVDSIESASYNDLLLVETTVRAAVAGSNVQVEEILPSLESYAGTKISTEALSDTILRMWESTSKALDKTWKKIESFFDKIYPSVGRVTKQAEKLKERAEDLADREVQVKSTELGPEINALAVDYKAPKNEKDILAALDELQKQCDALFGRQVENVAKVGSSIAKAIKAFDPEKPEESLESVTNAALELDFKASSNLIGAKTVKDKRYDEKAEVFKGPDLPGNKAIYLVRNAEVSDSALGRAEAARMRSATMRFVSDKERDALRGGTIATMSPASALSIRSAVQKLCKSIEDYSAGSGLKAVMKSQEEIRAAISSTAAKMKKDGVSQTAVAHYRSATNFASSFARWGSSPNTSLVSLALTASRAAITAANKSLSNY